MRHVCALLALVSLVGCSEPEGVTVARWSLDASGRRAHAVTVPAHFDDLLAARPSRYVLRAEVEVPRAWRGRDLDFVVPYFLGVASLDAGGRRATSISTDHVRSYRRRGPQAWRIPGELTRASTIALELTVDYDWAHAGWLDTVPRLVPRGSRDAQTTWVRLVNDLFAAMALVALAQIGITYLGVFLVDRRRKAYLWFAIQGITASFWPLFVLGLSPAVFGRHEVVVVNALLAAAPVVSIYYVHEQFGLPPPSKLWPLGLGLTVVTALVASGPFTASPIASKATVAVVVAVVVYQLVTCTRLVLRRDRPPGALLILACWVILAGTCWSDSLFWAGFGEATWGMHLACPGLASFALLQSLFLSREHIRTLARSDDLNVELARRVELLEERQREIELLNEELRRKIAERSRQIMAALAVGGGEPRPLVAGEVVQQRYRIVKQIGAGGMGLVYEVERLSDGRTLALKITRASDGIALARLAREAEIASHVAHPNVVAILDVDVETSGILYLVLEHVDGPTLREQRGRVGNVPWALSVLRQIASGLEALREHGIVHRDLKPSNVILAITPDGGEPIAKITDFGISRQIFPRPAGAGDLEQDAIDTVAAGAIPGSHDTSRSGASSASPLTEPGQLAGTPLYIAPELVDDPDAMSHAADIFSLGVIAFELLTGKRPFAEAPIHTRLRGGKLEPAPSLIVVRPELDPAIARVLDACLDPDPAVRPTAVGIADAIRHSSITMSTPT